MKILPVYPRAIVLLSCCSCLPLKAEERSLLDGHFSRVISLSARPLLSAMSSLLSRLASFQSVFSR